MRWQGFWDSVMELEIFQMNIQTGLGNTGSKN